MKTFYAILDHNYVCMNTFNSLEDAEDFCIEFCKHNDCSLTIFESICTFKVNKNPVIKEKHEKLIF